MWGAQLSEPSSRLKPGCQAAFVAVSLCRAHAPWYLADWMTWMRTTVCRKRSIGPGEAASVNLLPCFRSSLCEGRPLPRSLLVEAAIERRLLYHCFRGRKIKFLIFRDGSTDRDCDPSAEIVERCPTWPLQNIDDPNAPLRTEAETHARIAISL